MTEFQAFKSSIAGLIWITVFTMHSASQTSAADLSITVRGGQPTTGQMLIGVFNSSQSFLDSAVVSIISPVGSDGSTNDNLSLSPGTYAVAVTYDVNGNEQMDRGALGLPAEPYGFSNNARGLLGPPSFAKSAFRLLPEGGTITITLEPVD